MAVAFAKSGRDGVPSPSVAGGRRWNADPTEMVGGGGDATSSGNSFRFFLLGVVRFFAFARISVCS